MNLIYCKHYRKKDFYYVSIFSSLVYVTENGANSNNLYEIEKKQEKFCLTFGKTGNIIIANE